MTLKKELQKIADQVKRRGTRGYCSTYWAFAQSKRYKVGQLVYAQGNGWGSKNNWHRKYLFICSLRTRRDRSMGGYLVWDVDKGKPKVLTNIGKMFWGERCILEGMF